MNEKKLYKVTITDENGKVVHEVESDCIIAAISDPSKGSKEQSAIHGVYMTNCPGVTIQHTFQALDTVKREAIAKTRRSALCWQWIASSVSLKSTA